MHLQYLFVIIVSSTALVIMTVGEKIHLNRYYLPTDNIFDYMHETLMSIVTSGNLTIREEKILQPLDHFNPLEFQGFYQKYFYTSTEELNGPLCVFIGGDAAIRHWWMRQVFLAQRCVAMNGHLFLLEHRFYGDSVPMFNMTIEHLRFLTVSQALEDVASFIVHIRETYNLENYKLFVFGVSYGGTLAALFRRKYPHLADAAVALSAPMKRDYENRDYLPSVGKKLRKGSTMCYMQIEHGLRQAARLMENHICVKRELPLCNQIQTNLGLCTPIRGMSRLDRRVFFSSVTKDFAFLAEYDGVLNVTLKHICNVVEHPSIAKWSPMDKLLAGDMLISQELFKSKVRSGLCLQTRKEPICEYLKEVSITHEAVALGRRQRLWQTCTEFASFRTSTGDGRYHPFGGADLLPASYFQEFCMCAFGPTINEAFTRDRVKAYTTMFGPASPLIGSRIIYTIGEHDPVLQRELKSIENLGKGSKTKYENIVYKVKGSAHCGEVFLKPLLTRLKPKQVWVVQEAIVDQLVDWLNVNI